MTTQCLKHTSMTHATFTATEPLTSLVAGGDARNPAAAAAVAAAKGRLLLMSIEICAPSFNFSVPETSQAGSRGVLLPPILKYLT